jgi:hypothetical protein
MSGSLRALGDDTWSSGYHRCRLPHVARRVTFGGGNTPRFDVTGSGNLTTASGGLPQWGHRRCFSFSAIMVTNLFGKFVFELFGHGVANRQRRKALRLAVHTLNCIGLSLRWLWHSRYCVWVRGRPNENEDEGRTKSAVHIRYVFTACCAVEIASLPNPIRLHANVWVCHGPRPQSRSDGAALEDQRHCLRA